MNMGGSNLPAGINPQMLQQLGIEGPVTNQVFVANVGARSLLLCTVFCKSKCFTFIAHFICS